MTLSEHREKYIETQNSAVPIVPSAVLYPDQVGSETGSGQLWNRNESEVNYSENLKNLSISFFKKTVPEKLKSRHNMQPYTYKTRIQLKFKLRILEKNLFIPKPAEMWYPDPKNSFLIHNIAGSIRGKTYRYRYSGYLVVR
jgi:hypothetical protein